MLRRALAGGVESGESFSEDASDSTPKDAAQRLEHYELETNKDGQPVELGRGAMGVTYKAFDVNLRCPVTLKVISEKYLGDETATAKICCGKRVPPRACVIPTSPRSSTLGGRGAITSTRWSLWREKLSTASSSAQDRLR